MRCARLTSIFILLLTGFAVVAVLALPAMEGCGSSESGAAGAPAEEVGGTPIDDSMPAVKLISPGATGAGEVPRFEWEAFEGAAKYVLMVQDANHKPVWSWQGTDTAINLGGLSGDRPADISGPIITPGSSWSVAAYDDAGKPLGVSVLRPVSP